MESTHHYARHYIKHKLCRKLAANWQNIKHKLNSYNNSVVRNWQQVGRILAAHGRSYACLSQRNPTLEVSSHSFSVSRTEQLNDKSHEVNTRSWGEAARSTDDQRFHRRGRGVAGSVVLALLLVPASVVMAKVVVAVRRFYHTPIVV